MIHVQIFGSLFAYASRPEKKKNSSGLAYRLSASVFLLIQKHNNPTIPLQKKSNYVLDLCVRLVGMLTYRFFFYVLRSYLVSIQLGSCDAITLPGSRFLLIPDSSLRRSVGGLQISVASLFSLSVTKFAPMALVATFY